MIDLHILLREWAASVWDTGLFDTTEDRFEFRLAHVKGVVMHLEVVPVVEIERERFVDSDRRKMTLGAFVLEPEYVGEKL